MTNTFKFNVSLNGRRIDSVFCSVPGCRTIAEAQESVKTSLVNHDGCNPDIKVRIAERITQKEYAVQGYYAGAWETVCTEDNKGEAVQRLKEYRENDNIRSYRIKTCHINLLK